MEMSKDQEWVFESMKSQWENDWGLMTDRLVAETDLENRTEALLYHIACSVNAWAAGIRKVNQFQQELFPKLQKMIEWHEQEIEQEDDEP